VINIFAAHFMSILKLKHSNLCHNMILYNENIEWAPPSPILVRTQPQTFVVSPILEVIPNNTLRSELMLLIFIIISTVCIDASGIFFTSTVKTDASDFYYD